MTPEEKVLFEETVREYVEAILQQKKFKEKAEALKDKVVNGMKELGENKFTVDNHYVQLVKKSSNKYIGNQACLSFLKNELNGQYVIEVVDEKALNEAMKKDESLATMCRELYEVVDSNSLTVKEV